MQEKETKRIELIEKLRKSGNAYVLTVPKDVVDKKGLKLGERIKFWVSQEQESLFGGIVPQSDNLKPSYI